MQTPSSSARVSSEEQSAVKQGLQNLSPGTISFLSKTYRVDLFCTMKLRGRSHITFYSQRGDSDSRSRQSYHESRGSRHFGLTSLCGRRQSGTRRGLVYSDWEQRRGYPRGAEVMSRREGVNVYRVYDTIYSKKQKNRNRCEYSASTEDNKVN